MQHELRSMPRLVQHVSDPEVREFIHNGTVPNAAFLLEQLDAVDKAACTWRDTIKGISLNVFRGFETEEELVKYFLKHAYKDGVTVLASEYRPN